MNEWAVKMQGITKQFGDFKANDNIDFILRQGTIHGLLGENGAGKTTLMNILYGLYRQESGRILINGKEEDIFSPLRAIELGIGMVHQHFMLARPMSVVENVMLGRKSRRGVFLDTKQTAEELRQLSDKYHMNIDPYAKIWQLSVGEQQRVEILSSIYVGARILILDEPTAVLTPQETEIFFETLRQMRNDGKSIILITHKLEEILSIVDEVTVLRDGRMVGTKVVDKKVTKDDLSRMMVGRDVLFNFPQKEKEPGAVCVRIEGLYAKNDKELDALCDFSLDIREGEIVGLAGVDGNGQKELCEVLTGLRMAERGSYCFEGEEILNNAPNFYIRKKISHIPEDRHSQGLALNWSLQNNLILKKIGEKPFAKHGILSQREIVKNWEREQAAYRIKAAGGNEEVRSLSGGNQQKVILARELSADPRFLIANQPTRGLDIGASEYVRNRILDARNGGAAVLLISADLEEILQISDRIAVIYDGKLMGILSEGADMMEIGAMMTGKRMETVS